VPAAAIGKMGVNSVSRGYSAADTFLDDRIDAIRQRTCQGCAFPWWVFWTSYSFWVIDSRISPKPL